MSRRTPASPIESLSAYDTESNALNVVIETPRGSRNKYKYDDQSDVFILRKVLPVGAVFPYDFGYVPGTRGDDGDPVDVLVLMDEPAFTGCVVQCRLIGVIEGEQTETDGTSMRNDRLVAVANEAHDYRDLKSLKDVNQNLLRELEYFFMSYNRIEDKEFKLIAARGPKQAKKLVDQGIAAAKEHAEKSHTGNERLERKSTVKKSTVKKNTNRKPSGH